MNYEGMTVKFLVTSWQHQESVHSMHVDTLDWKTLWQRLVAILTIGRNLLHGTSGIWYTPGGKSTPQQLYINKSHHGR